LDDTTDIMYLAEIYTALLSVTEQNTFFSAAHGIFSKFDHILGHKATLNKYKKTEIIPYIVTE
jgi:hypothetical protein